MMDTAWFPLSEGSGVVTNPQRQACNTESSVTRRWHLFSLVDTVSYLPGTSDWPQSQDPSSLASREASCSQKLGPQLKPRSRPEATVMILVHRNCRNRAALLFLLHSTDLPRTVKPGSQNQGWGPLSQVAHRTSTDPVQVASSGADPGGLHTWDPSVPS